MNKIILTLLLTTVFAAPAIAQNCVNSSRCDELGYSKTAADCNDLDTLVCPFDENKVFCVKAKPIEQIIPCDTGAVLYSDKKCYVNASSERTPIAVVFDGTKRLALALEEESIAYMATQDSHNPAPNCYPSSTLTSCGTDGKANTRTILDYGKANNLSYPAAEYCYNFYKTVTSTNAGDWWLPSAAELKTVSANKELVYEGFASLGKANPTGSGLVSNFSRSDSYTSSTGQGDPWNISIDDGSAAIDGWPHTARNVRCALGF